MQRTWTIALGLSMALAASAQDFSGTWETTYGEMTLTQKDSEVRGTYQMGVQTSTIGGKVEKTRLTFTYQESDTKGEGWFELSADGQEFQGQWREKDHEAWQPWIGKRKQSQSGFAGLWNTTYGKMRLLQTGDKIQGTYADGSILSGRLEAGKFSFQYKESNAEGEGFFELSKDSSSLHGKWKPKGGTEWTAWEGTRIVPVPGRLWLVIVEARWEGSLADREYSFGDMLRPFFARCPNVEVRHRYFNDEHSLRRWCSEVGYLAEPAVLLIATHGTPEGVVVGDRTIGAQAIAQSLRFAANLQLLHFSSCLIMKDRLAIELLKAIGKGCPFPISGYTTSVDWGASAVIEFMYLDLILSRGMAPAVAAKHLDKLLPFSGDKVVPDAPFPSAGFRLVKPEEVK